MADSGPTRIASLLISSHEARDPALHGFAAGLDPHERASVLGELEPRARRPDGKAPALLRALLSCAALRLQSAREAVRLMQAEVLAGRAGVICLSELRIAVLRHWEGHGDDAAEQPASARLAELRLLCDDLLGALLPAAATSAGSGASSGEPPVRPPSRAAASQWGDGPSLALGLLPTVLRALDSTHHEAVCEAGGGMGCAVGVEVDTSAAAVLPSGAVMSRLLESEWAPRCALPILSALEELHLSAAQRQVLMTELLCTPDDLNC
jgi:hypothetical protein